MRLSVAITWRIPVAHRNKLVNTAIGGWSMSSASAFQGGNPLVYGISGGTFFNNTTRANAVGDPLDGIGGPIVSRLNRYFNTAAFAVPVNFIQGNFARRVQFAEPSDVRECECNGRRSGRGTLSIQANNARQTEFRARIVF